MPESSTPDIFPANIKPKAPCTDPRARMLVSILASAATIAVSSFEGQCVLFGASLVYAFSIRRLAALAIAYAGIGLMMTAAALFTWGISAFVPALPFTFRGIAVPFMRGLVMLNVILPMALSSRIQDLLTAMKGLKLPFCIYIPAAVMIRFIPSFMNDIRQVSETLKIRGFNISCREMLGHPLLTFRLVFTPLLFRTLRTSEELGIAAELKGLDSECDFIPFRKPVWSKNDTILIAAALTAAAAGCIVHFTFGTPSSVHG